MAKNSTPLPEKVLLTPFEKSVIALIDYLVKNWNVHKKFRRKQELLHQLGLELKRFWEYKRAQRNIPKEYWHRISDVLTRQYNVHPGYLHTNKGEMFLNAPWIAKEDPAPYGIEDLQTQLKLLQKANEKLKAENTDLKKENRLQAKLIEHLESRTATRTNNKKK
jgi:hypothetical protein